MYNFVQKYFAQIVHFCIDNNSYDLYPKIDRPQGVIYIKFILFLGSIRDLALLNIE